MCESTAADSFQVYGCFSELGAAFQVLYLSKKWTDDDVISVIDEVTSECFFVDLTMTSRLD